MTHRPVRGRRFAAAGLAVSAVIVVVALVYLGLWRVTGTPPFSPRQVQTVQVGGGGRS